MRASAETERVETQQGDSENDVEIIGTPGQSDRLGQILRSLGCITPARMAGAATKMFHTSEWVLDQGSDPALMSPG